MIISVCSVIVLTWTNGHSYKQTWSSPGQTDTHTNRHGPHLDKRTLIQTDMVLTWDLRTVDIDEIVASDM